MGFTSKLKMSWGEEALERRVKVRLKIVQPTASGVQLVRAKTCSLKLFLSLEGMDLISLHRQFRQEGQRSTCCNLDDAIRKKNKKAEIINAKFNH